MALNISPGDDAVAQEQADPASVAENAPAPVEQPVAEDAMVEGSEAPVEAAPTEQEEQTATGDAIEAAEQGAAEAPVADAGEQPADAEARTPGSAPAAEVAPEAHAVEETAPVAADDAHDLIDELEDLIGRAHHFENAGIEKLRAAGLALIGRIRNAI